LFPLEGLTSVNKLFAESGFGVYRPLLQIKHGLIDLLAHLFGRAWLYDWFRLPSGFFLFWPLGARGQAKSGNRE